MADSWRRVAHLRTLRGSGHIPLSPSGRKRTRRRLGLHHSGAPRDGRNMTKRATATISLGAAPSSRGSAEPDASPAPLPVTVSGRERSTAPKVLASA